MNGLCLFDNLSKTVFEKECFARANFKLATLHLIYST